MNTREFKFYLFCQNVPLSNYYDVIRKRCRNIHSDHIIKAYQRIADLVFDERMVNNK